MNTVEIINKIDCKSIDQRKCCEQLIEFILNNNTTQNYPNQFQVMGWAGSGKTYIITALIHQLLVNNCIKRVAIIASTNKATEIIENKMAKYIDDLCTDKSMVFVSDKLEWLKQKRKIEIDITTIHKLFHYKNEFDINGEMHFVKPRKSKNPFAHYEVIIIDECSMIPCNTMLEIYSEMRQTGCKTILIGDPAQLPPVGESSSVVFTTNNADFMQLFAKSQLHNYNGNDDTSIIVNNKICDIRDLMFDDFVRMSKITLTTIVRSNDNGIINLSTNIRNWIMNGSKLKIKKFVGTNVTVCKNTDTTWFDSFISCIEQNKNAIIITWRNVQCDLYNNQTRKIINSKMATNASTIIPKFIKNDILIVNNYYISANSQSQSSSKNITKYYTSDQLRIVDIEIDQMKINHFTTKHKFVNVIFGSYCDQMKQTFDKTYKIYKLFVHKINENKVDCIYVVHEDDIAQLEKNKNEMAKMIQDFRKTFNSHRDKHNMIRYMWKNRYDKLFAPFCDVTYGAAITCHKSQASTYDYVFVDIDDILKNTNTIEAKKMVYTAITRAALQVHLLV